MIYVVATLTIKPETRAEFIAAATACIKETRKEPGCKTYLFTAELDDPGAFRIFEEWESDEALKAHFHAPHMKRFQAAMGGFGIKGMTVHRYEIASVGPLR